MGAVVALPKLGVPEPAALVLLCLLRQPILFGHLSLIEEALEVGQRGAVLGL